VSAALFDFGLHLFHCGQRQSMPARARTSISPSSSHISRRDSNDVFLFARTGSHFRAERFRATVLIETILAAFEMEEILYELREHSGRAERRSLGLHVLDHQEVPRPARVRPPDRPLVTMSVPFMRAYTELLVKTCHRRGAHAIGGMAAFIPSRRDPGSTRSPSTRCGGQAARGR